MKKLLLIAGVALLASCTQAHDGYVVKGKITGNNPALTKGKVTMSNRSEVYPIRDTADIINGAFSFKGKVQTPDNVTISVEGMDGRIAFFLENANITVVAVDSMLQDAVVTGSPTHDIFKSVSDPLDAFAKQYDLMNLSAEYRKPETTQERKDYIMGIIEQYQSLNDSLRKAAEEAHPVSLYSLYNLRSKIMYMNAAEADSAVAPYRGLPQFEGNGIISYVEEYIVKEKGLTEGSVCPDFTLNDPDGKAITLSDVYKQNKVTMIDFWASWCGPCRAFNPSLTKIYAKYHRKGFEVFGVSFDRENGREQWLKAIEDDALPWIHVSDLKGWNCAAGKLYNVSYIPQNVFVDAEGKIIGRRLEEGAIEALLESHFQ